MTETLPQVIVGMQNEQELIAAMQRYRGLRTFPAAHEASQRRLHETCVGLEQRGLVVGRKDGGSAWVWHVA